MRTALAERLLVKIMEWNPEEVRIERPLLQALANFKYDEYQQFSIGTRFMESLMKWLKQFETIEEKKIAYGFLKNNLVFISNNQMLHLVGMTFSDQINPRLIEQTATALGVKPYKISFITNNAKYSESLRRSLFIGLSDGSRIDQLRRSGGFNNEQVIPTYSINDDKARDMVQELIDSGYKNFNTVFLVDDFTASGTSYFRFLETDKVWKGKICKTLISLLTPPKENTEKGLNILIDHTGVVNIHIIFYIATKEALDSIKANYEKWMSENSIDSNMIKITIQAIQIIDSSVRENVINNTSFLKIAKKYFNASIVDKHYKKGKHESPYLGFNEGALPVILIHNTPNNSLPIIWQEPYGLFPRITRHK